jgi:hypothetical protein
LSQACLKLLLSVPSVLSVAMPFVFLVIPVLLIPSLPDLIGQSSKRNKLWIPHQVRNDPHFLYITYFKGVGGVSRKSLFFKETLL